jgi:hypothetical protein
MRKTKQVKMTSRPDLRSVGAKRVKADFSRPNPWTRVYAYRETRLTSCLAASRNLAFQLAMTDRVKLSR